MTAKGLYRFYSMERKGRINSLHEDLSSIIRLQVQTYDNTHLLHEGINALGVMSGDGWWRGLTGLADVKYNFGYKVFPWTDRLDLCGWQS